jgi:hypothetical protein
VRPTGRTGVPVGGPDHPELDPRITQMHAYNVCLQMMADRRFTKDVPGVRRDAKRPSSGLRATVGYRRRQAQSRALPAMEPVGEGTGQERSAPAGVAL